MNQTQAPLIFGDETVALNQWQQLEDLWLFIAPGNNVLTLSHTYAQHGRGSWLQFSSLVETRFPQSSELVITQKLSARPIVARPNHPLYLPAGERATLYVGTSLWFSLNWRTASLLDVPVTRLSDTWFGPNTRVGEVCYACQTHARLSMEGVAANPMKAITPIRIKNETDRHLVIDRVNLPVPHLTLYRGQDRHWTSQVTISKRTPDAQSEIHISTEPPRESPSAVEVAAPRIALKGGILHKAMGLLLG